MGVRWGGGEQGRWSDHHYIGAAVGVVGGSILTFALLAVTEGIFGEEPEPRVITRTSEVEVEVERVPKHLMVVSPNTPLLIDGQEYECQWEGEPGGRVNMVTCTAKEE